MSESHELILLQQHGMFNFCKCCAKSMECSPLFCVKMGVNYPQAMISVKRMKLSVIYTTAMKGDKRLLKKKRVNRGFSALSCKPCPSEWRPTVLYPKRTDRLVLLR